MKARCSNKNTINYSIYGGKGIRVCEAWLDFETFRTWANENGYTDALSIDRVDSNWHYDPSNCEWVTPSENSRRCRKHYWRSMTCNV